MSIETSKTESEKKKEWKRQNRVSKNHGTTADPETSLKMSGINIKKSSPCIS